MVTWGRIGQTACPRDWFVTSVITVILTVALHGHCNTGHGPGLTGKPSRGAGLSNTTFTIIITDGFTLCSWIHFKESFEIHNTHRLLTIEIAGYFNLKNTKKNKNTSEWGYRYINQVDTCITISRSSVHIDNHFYTHCTFLLFHLLNNAQSHY